MVKGWTGKDNDQKVSHGEGLAFLLTAAESGQSSDQFHETIRDTLYVPVVSVERPMVVLSSGLVLTHYV